MKKGVSQMLQKLNKKLSRNQKGFSLIELMVAVAILAMAAFGIFQAFTTGFMGMAESRDRTEAVNYLQKTLEKYKNLPFTEIVDQQITKLKKVIAQIRWKDREGNIKTEEASTTIYSTPKTGEISSPYKIVLYATPYYRILPDSDSWLTAEIQDKNNNLINDWFGKIDYQIIEGDFLGFLDKTFEMTNNGKSTNRFWSGSNTGSVIIEASAELKDVGTVTDVVEITILTEGIAIMLEPDEDDDILRKGETATINLSVVKADYLTIDENYTGTIDLASSSPGILSTKTITLDETDNGIATFTVTATETGKAEIIASAENLDMGYTEITFGDVGHSIKLTPEETSILAGENTNIDITILDDEGNATTYTGIITINGGPYGNSTDVIFSNNANKRILFSYNIAGEIEINANGNNLIGDTIIIEVLESKIPSYIKIISDKDKLYTSESAKLSARIYDDNNDLVTNYNEEVSFTISDGEGYFSENNTTIKAINGVTPEVKLYSNYHGLVNIIANSTTSNGKSLNPGNKDILFYSLPSYMEISKTPTDASIPANGSSFAEIKLEIHGMENDITEIFGYIVNFDTNLDGSILSNKSVYPIDGIATTNVYSSSIGKATITATVPEQSSYNLEQVTIDVDFINAEPTNLYLVEEEGFNVISADGETIILFYVGVTGSPLELKNIEISGWKKGTLNAIAIKSPWDSTNYDPDIQNILASPEPYVATDNDIDNTSFVLGKTLIRLIFSESQKNESIDITFVDDIGNEYPVNFRVPQS
jgi:prepilin-type N-terminal cleavage/methylation domain-containing protein